MSNTHTLKTSRWFSGKKSSGTSKVASNTEEYFNPEFIKEVKQSIQDIKYGKGIKYNSLEDLFASYEK